MQTKTAKHLSVFALITALILSIPLIAMQFTEEVQWTVSDFIFMGMLLFGSGVIYELLTRNMKKSEHRVIVGIVVTATVLFVWVAGATGLGMG